MHVLLTAMSVANRTGAELYVAEVARALVERQHRATVLATVRGPLADELEREGIPVLGRLSPRMARPDIVHAQSAPATRLALARYPDVPALYVCHGHDRRRDVLPPYPSVRRYAGVSSICVEAQLRRGSPPSRTLLMPNFVDTRIFRPRPPLPASPRRAVLFSNYATPDGFAGAVREACRRRQIELDIVGAGAGKVSDRPHDLLVDYDVVFAKGRAAIEAMAVGCAVVLCDAAGVGPMVAESNAERLRAMNFGFAALDAAHEPEVIVARLDLYDAHDAARVRDWIRTVASLERYMTDLDLLYRELIEEKGPGSTLSTRVAQAVSAVVSTAGYRAWYRLPDATLVRARALRPPSAHR